MPVRVALLLAVAVGAAVLLWPRDVADPPRAVSSAPQPLAPPRGPLARGIERSRLVITVRRGTRAYELRGGLDLSEGYRFRGRVTEGSYRYVDSGPPIWLAGGRGAWRGFQRPVTLTKQNFAFDRDDPVWFDEHPPTLPLTRVRPNAYDSNYLKGAEVYAHLSLLALKHARHGRAFDFTPYGATQRLEQGRNGRRPDGCGRGCRRGRNARAPTVRPAAGDGRRPHLPI